MIRNAGIGFVTAGRDAAERHSTFQCAVGGPPTTFAKGFLLFGAVVFVGIGIGFLVVPVQWASLVQISLPTATARTDLRATYGGFDLAMGVFLAVCASRADWIRPGLAAMSLAAAGFAGGRLLGIGIEGTASPLMLTFAAVESASALLAFYLLRRLSPGLTHGVS